MNEPSATLLIVDDQPENLAVLCNLLEPHYRVRVAATGERALQLAAMEPQPDLILLDVMMPGMNGYETLSALRQNPLTREIPVMFVTARDSEYDEEYGLELGAADYITKPISPPIVLARVRVQLENKRAQDILKDKNAWLEAEVKRRMRDNELIQDATLHALAILAETRDADTGGHLYRTQTYVAVMVSELAKNEKYAALKSESLQQKIVRASTLHDIGKVGIPDQILRKPGKLSAEEYAVMQRHARIGGETIRLAMQRVLSRNHGMAADNAALSFLAVAAEIAQSHHERWDGKGYPDGLQGESIPLAARIMAVSDVYDALVTFRPYKKIYSHEEAVEIIRAERGAHFDPDLVDVFERIHPQYAEIAAKYADTH
ncbi:MAG: response regulator [Rhodocyclaceae bacterium]|nr:response regulator [Rhodocyclaceae bacterium]